MSDSQTLEQVVESNESDRAICQICQIVQSEDHKSSTQHKHTLELYKKFMSLEDREYKYYRGLLQLTLDSRNVKHSVRNSTTKLFDEHNKEIVLIYERRDWARGINLLQTKCIPELNELIKTPELNELIKTLK